jgi:hypothetical protein
MNLGFRKRYDTARILDFSFGPAWFRVSGTVVVRAGYLNMRRTKRFAVQRGYVFPSLVKVRP